MTVRNRRNQGAVFTIMLPPAALNNHDKTPKTADNSDFPDAKIKFLMIDDEINILKMMEMFFEDTDVDISTAPTAEKGLLAIRNDRL